MEHSKAGDVPPVYDRLYARHRWWSRLTAFIGVGFLVHWGVTGQRSNWGSLFFLGAMIFLFIQPRVLKGILARDVTKKNLLACLDCGYNLAGNESGYCPECGLQFDSSATREAWRLWSNKEGRENYGDDN